MTAPVDLETLRSFLNLDSDDTTEDTELQAMLDASTEAVEARVGPMVSRAFTDQRVYGRNGVVILPTPLVSVESLSWQGQALDLTVLDVDLNSGIVSNPYAYTLGFWWWWGTPAAPGLPFIASYTAGRDPVPGSLKYATMIVAEQMWKTQRGGSSSAASRFGGSTEQVYSGFLWPNRALELIAPYEQLAFA